jgi:hypothetical protein
MLMTVSLSTAHWFDRKHCLASSYLHLHLKSEELHLAWDVIPTEGAGPEASCTTGSWSMRGCRPAALVCPAWVDACHPNDSGSAASGVAVGAAINTEEGCRACIAAQQSAHGMNRPCFMVDMPRGTSQTSLKGCSSFCKSCRYDENILSLRVCSVRRHLSSQMLTAPPGLPRGLPAPPRWGSP